MAKLECTCGTIIRDDHPHNGLLLQRDEFDIDLDSSLLFGRARSVWRCWVCGRLWVFWDHVGKPTEYVPAEPPAQVNERR
jgi:hypothetical protein